MSWLAVSFQRTGRHRCEGVHALVGSAGTGPANLGEVAHVGVADAANLVDGLLQEVLHCLAGGTLTIYLQSFVLAPVVAQVERHFSLFQLAWQTPLGHVPRQ